MTVPDERGPHMAGPGSQLGGETSDDDSAAEGMRKRPFIAKWRSAVLNSQEPASVKLTLLALAEFANALGRKCYPGTDALARLASQNEKTCRRSLDTAADRWFTRTPVKFKGRDWRGYSYALQLPQAANTVPATGREVADTTPAPQTTSCGHSDAELRTFQLRAAGTVSDELDKATSKSNQKERARAKKTIVTLPTWLPADAWQDWKDYRGNSFSSRAQALAISKLTSLRGEGHDPRKLIDLAIESGWSSVYPRDQTLANGKTVGTIDRDQRTEDEIARANEEQLARFGLGSP